jgi:hypothetical protein
MLSILIPSSWGEKLISGCIFKDYVLQNFFTKNGKKTVISAQKATKTQLSTAANKPQQNP